MKLWAAAIDARSDCGGDAMSEVCYCYWCGKERTENNAGEQCLSAPMTFSELWPTHRWLAIPKTIQAESEVARSTS